MKPIWGLVLFGKVRYQWNLSENSYGLTSNKYGYISYDLTSYGLPSDKLQRLSQKNTFRRNLKSPITGTTQRMSGLFSSSKWLQLEAETKLNSLPSAHGDFLISLSQQFSTIQTQTYSKLCEQIEETMRLAKGNHNAIKTMPPHPKIIFRNC